MDREILDELNLYQGNDKIDEAKEVFRHFSKMFDDASCDYVTFLIINNGQDRDEDENISKIKNIDTSKVENITFEFAREKSRILLSFDLNKPRGEYFWHYITHTSVAWTDDNNETALPHKVAKAFLTDKPYGRRWGTNAKNLDKS